MPTKNALRSWLPLLALPLGLLLTPWDRLITRALQAAVPRALDAPLSVISLLGSAEVSLLVLAGLLWYRRGNWSLPLYLFLTGQAAEVLLKWLLTHPSPPAIFHRTVTLLPLLSSHVNLGNSFPSGHAFRLTFLVALLWPRERQRWLLRWGLGLFLLVVYLSRISLGEHWASDVWGGAALGIFLGFWPGLNTSGPAPGKKEVSPL